MEFLKGCSIDPVDPLSAPIPVVVRLILVHRKVLKMARRPVKLESPNEKGWNVEACIQKQQSSVPMRAGTGAKEATRSGALKVRFDDSMRVRP